MSALSPASASGAALTPPPRPAKPRFSAPVTIAELGVHVNDPIEHLRNCHQRIQRSLVTVQNAVAGFLASAPALRAEAAAALEYELATLDLLETLHMQDEEQALFPRLRKNLGSDPHSLGELLSVLESQHRTEDAIFVKLAASVKTCLAMAGSLTDEQLAELESLVAQLLALCEPHMTLEDSRVLVHCGEYLTAEDLQGMKAEMQARFKDRGKR